MRSGSREEKKAAHAYLDDFQKSVSQPHLDLSAATPPLHLLTTPTQNEAWQIVLNILESNVADEAKLFAATTLKGKVSYTAIHTGDRTLTS